MSRCDYDTIFQRVLCVTLIAIAFTLTVILTNVFVDIDGLLSRKERDKIYTNEEAEFEEDKYVKKSRNAIEPQTYYISDRQMVEKIDSNFRNKRSLESQNFLFHIKSPKMKSILTSRLATLLEELDEEETQVSTEKPKSVSKPSINDKVNIKREDKKMNPINDKVTYLTPDYTEMSFSHRREEDLLHNAMHDILLKGIRGHMDFNDVYEKIHHLVNTFKNPTNLSKDKKKNSKEFTKQMNPRELPNSINLGNEMVTENYKYAPHKSVKPSSEEIRLLEEFTGCSKLGTDLSETVKVNAIGEKPAPKKIIESPNVLIKTIIDISSQNRLHQQNSSFSNENVKGIIQLIYNGKSIKFSRLDDDNKPMKKTNDKSEDQSTTPSAKEYSDKVATESDFGYVMNSIQEQYGKAKTPRPDSYLGKLLGEYLEKDSKRFTNVQQEDEIKQNSFDMKRQKRQIKIRYEEGEARRNKPKSQSSKTNDDELYVEIETHFDSKGLKGEKKKKLIRNLITKIQQAIHTDIESLKLDSTKKSKSYHVKKRIQHPLDKNNTLHNKNINLHDSANNRQPDPDFHEKSGEKWKKENYGTGFLTGSKSLNSDEQGEIGDDFTKALGVDGIPQRLQKPLYSGVDESDENANTYFDVGNLKFYIKDLGDTGLSIGFNQYTDEQPDMEAMKLFTGIENVVSNYHQVQDQEERIDLNENQDKLPRSKENIHSIFKRETNKKTNQHVIIRRSIKELNEKDYHSNEFKVIFDAKNLPYDNYEEILEDENKRLAISIKKEPDILNVLNTRKSSQDEMVTNLMKDNIFYQNLQPSEILNIAGTLKRKKRAINVQKISNIKNKLKVNKYINTNRMKKKIIMNNKRAKRQIDKIRIVERGRSAKERQSAENIFLVSNENLLADRAIIREIETPDEIIGDAGDDKPADHYHNIIPYVYEDTQIANTFDNKLRQKLLMSKYPHIFMEEVARSNEQFDPLILKKVDMSSRRHRHKHQLEITTESSTSMNIFVPKVEDIVSAITPHQPRQNYKLTVKIMPKNISNLNSGFKEVHTSINKSFNKNGMLYSSLVNVSEISKFENLHNPTDPTTAPLFMESPTIPSTKSCFGKHIEDQQAKMDFLLKGHKKRIDEQLEHLKKEKMSLEKLTQQKMLETTTEAMIMYPTSLPRVNNIDIEKLLASALIKLSDAATTTTLETTTASTTITPSTTTVKPLNEEKIEIINTIQRNGNLTYEILHQLNRNTAMLQTFLSKLSDRLFFNEAKEKVTTSTDSSLKFWKTLPFVDNPMNLDTLRNETHVPIPFVYAFQQPYGLNYKAQSGPMASVVYHGHLHTNGFQPNHPTPKDTWKRNIENDNNHTKFFFDDIVNGFKTVSSGLSHKEGLKPIQMVSHNKTRIP